MEPLILSASLKNKEDFLLFKQHLDIRQWSREFQIVFGLIDSYYQRDQNVQDVNVELLTQQIAAAYPVEKHANRFKAIVEEAALTEPPTANIRETVLIAKRDGLAQALAMAIANRKPHIDLLQEYNELLSVESLAAEESGIETYTAADIDRLLAEEIDDSTRLPIMPRALNDRLEGGLRPDDAVILLARPEMGKTALILTIACGLAKRGHRVVIFNNEEAVTRLFMRAISCLTGLSGREVRENITYARELAMENGFNNLVFIAMSPGSPQQIDKELEKYPDAVAFVVDQLRNLSIKTENKTIQLEEAAKQIRNIAKRRHLVSIAVTQAGDSAEGKSVLGMGDADGSNCLAKGQLVRMYDGSKKAIEDIKIGEQVMGLDSTPRTVLKVGAGSSMLYRVSQKDGKSYDVNEAHILTLEKTTGGHYKHRPGTLVDFKLTDLIKHPHKLHHYKGRSFGVELPEQVLPIDPYYLGLWLADGSKNKPEITSKDICIKDWVVAYGKRLGFEPNVCVDSRSKNPCYSIHFADRHAAGRRNRFTSILKELNVLNNKHIPACYLTSSREQRLALLAGLIDGDGYLNKKQGNHYYEIAAHRFQTDILELCWSLGFKATMIGENRIYVSGPLSVVPCKLSRKGGAVDASKNVLASTISFDKIGFGEWYGITVDGDERYLLANYVVTHNTGIPGACDVMIGVGADEQQQAQGIRVLTLIKNKISGIHESFPVRINQFISKYVSFEV